MANELCGCGCGREADTVSRGDAGGRFFQMPGLWYSVQCWELFRRAAYDHDHNSDGDKMERVRGQYMDKVRARRAALADDSRFDLKIRPESVEPEKPNPNRDFVRARELAYAQFDRRAALNRGWTQVSWAPSVHPDAEPYVLPKSEPIAPGEYDQPAAASATCATCSSPATCGEHCVYCARRAGVGGWDQRIHMRSRPEDKAAGKRLALMDRREAKRPTATDRQNAKAHPWDCGGKDEP